MILNIDFNSEEAIYIQLRNQIVIGIATSQLEDGDTLPSVRQLADNIGINMHTVNKAYSVLKQEGFVKLDRRKGAVIALDAGQGHCRCSGFQGRCRLCLQRQCVRTLQEMRFMTLSIKYMIIMRAQMSVMSERLGGIYAI